MLFIEIGDVFDFRNQNEPKWVAHSNFDVDIIKFVAAYARLGLKKMQLLLHWNSKTDMQQTTQRCCSYERIMDEQKAALTTVIRTNANAAPNAAPSLLLSSRATQNSEQDARIPPEYRQEICVRDICK